MKNTEKKRRERERKEGRNWKGGQKEKGEGRKKWYKNMYKGITIPERVGENIKCEWNGKEMEVERESLEEIERPKEEEVFIMECNIFFIFPQRKESELL